jgi:hypothetical protein
MKTLYFSEFYFKLLRFQDLQMKRILLIALIFIAGYNSTSAQTNPFAEKEIIWYGIDFSAAKLIGPDGFNDLIQVKSKYFDAWNDIVVEESDKYNVKKYFAKDKVFDDLSVVQARNAKVNTEGLVIDEEYSFEKEKVAEIIKSYETEQNYGVGLVFIVESLNKSKITSFVHVTFFDVKTKEVLFTSKVKGEPMGFSFRNYWAGSFLSVMIRSERKLVTWEKEFKRAQKEVKN